MLREKPLSTNILFTIISVELSPPHGVQFIKRCTKRSIVTLKSLSGDNLAKATDAVPNGLVRRHAWLVEGAEMTLSRFAGDGSEMSRGPVEAALLKRSH